MKKTGHKISIKTIFAIIISVALLLEAIGYTCVGILFPRISEIRKTATDLTDSISYAEQLDKGSQLLTLCAHNYVASGDFSYFVEYWEYCDEKQVRQEAVQKLTESDAGLSDDEIQLIKEALDISNLLINDEMVAMYCTLKWSSMEKAEESGTAAPAVDWTYLSALIADYNENLPDGENTCTWITEETCNEITGKNTKNEDYTAAWNNAVAGAGLTGSDFSAEEYKSVAIAALFSSDYNEGCLEIYSKVQQFSNTISARSQTALNKSVHTSIVALIIITVLLVVIMIFVAITMIIYERTLIRPILKLNKQLDTDAETYSVSGIQEINDLSVKYNSNKEVLTTTNKELELQAKIYKEESRRDFLTRLANREMLEEYLDGMFAGEVAPFVLYMIDADDFKKVNDTYGHTCGDEVLKSLGRIFKDLGKKHDGIAARYGGEELVLTATGITYADIDTIADEILNSVRGLRIAYADKLIRITVSVGSCYSLSDGTTRKNIIQNADAALYRSKATGKNRHTHYYPSI